MGGAREAHADLVTYNMTGTVTSAGNSDFGTIVNAGGSFVPGSVNIGDHISWTLQYDRSSPWGNLFYTPTAAVLYNVVDRTTGVALYCAASVE